MQKTKEQKITSAANPVVTLLSRHFSRCKPGYQFTLRKLGDIVWSKRQNISEETIGRSLRKLRKSGGINYEVVDHNEVIYKLTK
jgi:hypothetical protein